MQTSKYVLEVGLLIRAQMAGGCPQGSIEPAAVPVQKLILESGLAGWLGWLLFVESWGWLLGSSSRFGSFSMEGNPALGWLIADLPDSWTETLQKGY